MVEQSQNLSWIWNERFWFPPDRPWGWKDLQNVAGSSIYYPQVEDLHWSILLGVGLLGVRYLLETLIVVPIAVRMGIPNKKRKPLDSNKALEQAFLTSRNPDEKMLKALCKQTDLTERQVQIWFRKRRMRDLPTPMQKFRECSWHLMFYGTFFIYGLYVLLDKPWFWETKLQWIGWPKLHVDREIYWYYLIETAFYWSLIFTLFSDHKRKDFKEMIVHHVTTITLMYFSWMLNFVRTGSIIVLIHDSADSWLSLPEVPEFAKMQFHMMTLFDVLGKIAWLAKMGRYTRNEKFTDFFFVGFLIVWIISRLIFYPFVILYSTSVTTYQYVMDETFGSHWFFNFFLYVLQVLHILWSYSIARIVYRRVMKGQVDDVRSDLSEDAEDDHDEDEEEDQITSNGVNGSINGKPNGSISGKPNGSINGKPNGSINGKPGASINGKPGISINGKPGSLITTGKPS